MSECRIQVSVDEEGVVMETQNVLYTFRDATGDEKERQEAAVRGEAKDVWVDIGAPGEQPFCRLMPDRDFTCYLCAGQIELKSASGVRQIAIYIRSEEETDIVQKLWARASSVPA